MEGGSQNHNPIDLNIEPYNQNLNPIDLNNEPCDQNLNPIDLNKEPCDQNLHTEVGSFLPDYDNRSERWKNDPGAELLESRPTVPDNYAGVESNFIETKSTTSVFGEQDSFLGSDKRNNGSGFSEKHTGDRKFSQWKGSVLDSVIGVFLKQNMSDHLSSSAFMALAAKSPLQSTNINQTCYQNGTTALVEEPDVQHFTSKHQLKRAFSTEPTEEVRVQGQTNARQRASNDLNFTGQRQTTERTNIKEQRENPRKRRRGKEKTMSNSQKEKAKGQKGKEFDWDTMDLLDYEAVRCAEVKEISDPIIKCGMNYVLTEHTQVSCTKINANCNACPMRGECRPFASAFTSARLALLGPEERSIVPADRNPAFVNKHMPLALAGNSSNKGGIGDRRYEPVVKEPATMEADSTEIIGGYIEDAFNTKTKTIPMIDLDTEEFIANLHSYIQDNMELQEADISKAIVAMNPEAASIPAPKLKNANRRRTEHLVYQLPDEHPLLDGLDKREHDDPSPYLLAIWTPGETSSSVQAPENMRETNGSANSTKEPNAETVRGTLLIPCRTAMRGRFPLNGTCFQVNEVFADHETSQNPIDVPRACICNLPRQTVYFGTSISTIFKGLTTAEIQICFWRGFICVRGFERRTRSPRLLINRFHFPPTKNEGKSKTQRGTQLWHDMICPYKG